MDDPYQPPSVDPQAPRKAVEQCPSCGATLELGTVSGSLYWLPDTAGALHRFAGGKRVTGHPPFSIRLRQATEVARRCPACELILIARDP